MSDKATEQLALTCEELRKECAALKAECKEYSESTSHWVKVANNVCDERTILSNELADAKRELVTARSANQANTERADRNAESLVRAYQHVKRLRSALKKAVKRLKMHTDDPECCTIEYLSKIVKDMEQEARK